MIDVIDIDVYYNYEEEAIDALTEKGYEAHAAGDADTMAAGYTEDCWALFPGKQMIRGRAGQKIKLTTYLLLDKAQRLTSTLKVTCCFIYSYIFLISEFKDFIEKNYFGDTIGKVRMERLHFIEAGDHAVEVNNFFCLDKGGKELFRGK